MKRKKLKPGLGPALPLVAEAIRTASRRVANQELRGVTRTLTSGNAERSLERVRTRLIEQITLAEVTNDPVWRIGALDARACIVELQGTLLTAVRGMQAAEKRELSDAVG